MWYFPVSCTVLEILKLNFCVNYAKARRKTIWAMTGFRKGVSRCKPSKVECKQGRYKCIYVYICLFKNSLLWIELYPQKSKYENFPSVSVLLRNSTTVHVTRAKPWWNGQILNTVCLVLFRKEWMQIWFIQEDSMRRGRLWFQVNSYNLRGAECCQWTTKIQRRGMDGSLQAEPSLSMSWPQTFSS